jgi:O-antigen ligase
MIWLLGGYMWLYVHRPFEVWPSLGALQIERGYMLLMLVVWAVTPGKTFAVNRIHVALFFFTTVLVTAWVVSPYADSPGCADVVENYVKVSVFYYLVVTTVRDERGLRLLVLLFLGAVGLYMAHSILEFINGKYQWRMGIRRMIGVDMTFSDPNAFASTLLYTLTMTLPFWKDPRRRVPRWLLGGYVLAALGCVLMTGSRSGFMGCCLLAAMVLVSSAKRKGQVIVLGGLGAAAAFLVLLVVLPEELQNRYLTLVDSSRGPENARVSADGRLDGLLHGLRVWQQSPLFGWGPASFPYSTGRGGHAHNVYGQVMSELGLMGALGFVVLVVCFGLNAAETRRRTVAAGLSPGDDFVYQVSRAVGFNVILLLVMGWAGHNLYRYNWQWFAAFGAVSLCCARARAPATPFAAAGGVVPAPRAGFSPAW